jgi:hypothetical protein
LLELSTVLAFVITALLDEEDEPGTNGVKVMAVGLLNSFITAMQLFLFCLFF